MRSLSKMSESKEMSESESKNMTESRKRWGQGRRLSLRWRLVKAREEIWVYG